jgi:serine/threonine protein kinase
MAQFSHRNILSLIGVCTAGMSAGKPVILVLEMCEHGELKQFLRSSKTFRVLTLSARLAIAADIAKGMEYLSSRRFVHRDLASRNVLINTQYVCKVADFGMARGVAVESEYYRSKGGVVPVRWTAVEALKFNRFSEVSFSASVI